MTIQPWERQSAETARAYAAFCIYRDQGPTRTLQVTTKRYYGEGKKSQSRIEAWSARWKWVSRCREWDSHLDELNREKQTQARLEMSQRHAEKAKELQEKALTALQALEEEGLSAGDNIRLWIESVKIERAARGADAPGAGDSPDSPSLPYKVYKNFDPAEVV